jgi:diguanylate cyclase (GGDEF)-like protein
VNAGRAVSAETRVALVAIAAGAVAAALVVLAPGGPGALVAAPWWMVILVAAGFAAAERGVFHLEHRREAITVSLSEVPMLYAALFLDVRVAVAARVVGGMAAVLSERRIPRYKALFCVAQFAVEVALAGFVLRLLVPSRELSSEWYLALGVPAVVVASVAGSVLVSAAVAQFEGDFVRRVGSDLRTASWMCALYASIGGLIVSPALIAPWLAPFALMPLVVFWLYLRRQTAISQQLNDVRDLHGFAGRVAGEVDLDRISRVAVTEAAQLLRATDCSLFVMGDDGFVPLAVHGAHMDPPASLPPSTAEPVTDAEGVAGDEPAPRGQLLPDGSCVAPLVADRRPVGVLAVRGRLGVNDRFDADDLDRLQTLADQLAATVARGLLHRKLEREARQDSLTGLANRRTFERHLESMPIPPGSTAFVIMLDLDRFKEVNDTLGHAAGDELLIGVAERLRGVVAGTDLLARFAGDEYAITGTRRSVEEIDRIARDCIESLGQRYGIGGLEIVVNASAGVAVDDGTSDPADRTPTMLRHADIAMYHAKQHHLGHEFYRSEIDRRTPARLSMLADLRVALDHGRLHQHFQPKLDLATGLVCGAEVLARWNHPTRGAISPADFVAVAEQSGLIRRLTDDVLDGTVRALVRLDIAGHPIGLSMNISPHDLLDELLVDRIARRLDQHAVDPGRLTLEITEGTLLYDSQRTRANIARLHEMGVHLSIDDFGTGYSSLQYLRQLPVSELKIDKSFIFDLMGETRDETIVRSTIDLGHNLGLRVVAEGVETQDVADRLRELGCDTAQGYGISRPVPIGRMIEWLDARRSSTPAALLAFAAPTFAAPTAAAPTAAAPTAAAPGGLLLPVLPGHATGRS